MICVIQTKLLVFFEEIDAKSYEHDGGKGERITIGSSPTWMLLVNAHLALNIENMLTQIVEIECN